MEEIILKEREFKENIVQVINNSGLPAFILKPVIKELYEQLDVLEQNQYIEAKSKVENEKKEADGHGNEENII